MTITATTEITESDTRSTRLQVLEAQVCSASDDIRAAGLCGDIGLAFDAYESLATLLQHTLQELDNLATETSPRGTRGPGPAPGSGAGSALGVPIPCARRRSASPPPSAAPGARYWRGDHGDDEDRAFRPGVAGRARAALARGVRAVRGRGRPGRGAGRDRLRPRPAGAGPVVGHRGHPRQPALRGRAGQLARAREGVFDGLCERDDHGQWHQL